MGVWSDEDVRSREAALHDSGIHTPRGAKDRAPPVSEVTVTENLRRRTTSLTGPGTLELKLKIVDVRNTEYLSCHLEKFYIYIYKKDNPLRVDKHSFLKGDSGTREREDEHGDHKSIRVTTKERLIVTGSMCPPD